MLLGINYLHVCFLSTLQNEVVGCVIGNYLLACLLFCLRYKMRYVGCVIGINCLHVCFFVYATR